MSQPAHNGKNFFHMEGDGLSAPAGFRDRAVMTDGDDHRHGGNAPDILYGFGGDDRLAGGEGPDELYGGDGNDLLRGGPGAGDFIYGGAGNDSIRGGAGAGDELYGGDGADTFHYASAARSNAGAHDTIWDFETGVDTVKLGKDFAGVTAADIHISVNGSGEYVVTIDGSTFELVSKTAIAVTDFHF